MRSTHARSGSIPSGMKLYFSPLACSLATRIALYEAGKDAEYEEVDPKTKTTRSGADYLKVHPLGFVPVLALDDGGLLTENAAILQHIADRYPDARLAPADASGRTRLREWLSFIGTELHKASFMPLLDKKAPEVVKQYALEKANERLDWLAQRLEGRELVLGDFSVADAYLFTVLNWTAVMPIDLSKWPAIGAYMARMHARPAVARAFAEERALYMKAA
jgi:glutathione S-transferase